MVLTKLEPAVIRDGDSCHIGNVRIGSYCPNWDRLKTRFENLGAGSCKLTRRRLQLDSPPNTVTGWYTKSFEETEIEGIVISQTATPISTIAGVYPRLDAILYTADVIVEGDELLDYESNAYYQVETVKPIKAAGCGFSHRECDLTAVPLHDLAYADTTPTVDDARYLTKAYWEKYLSLSNLNNHPYLVCYAWPDYPLSHVFRTKGKHIIYAVDTPESEALLDANMKAYGYHERVPTHVCTLDTELNHLAEQELRRISGAYPEGSLRSLERRGTEIKSFGSTFMYDTTVMLDYRRDLT